MLAANAGLLPSDTLQQFKQVQAAAVQTHPQLAAVVGDSSSLEAFAPDIGARPGPACRGLLQGVCAGSRAEQRGAEWAPLRPAAALQLPCRSCFQGAGTPASHPPASLPPLAAAAPCCGCRGGGQRLLPARLRRRHLRGGPGGGGCCSTTLGLPRRWSGVGLRAAGAGSRRRSSRVQAGPALPPRAAPPRLPPARCRSAGAQGLQEQHARAGAGGVRLHGAQPV